MVGKSKDDGATEGGTMILTMIVALLGTIVALLCCFWLVLPKLFHIRPCCRATQVPPPQQPQQQNRDTDKAEVVQT